MSIRATPIVARVIITVAAAATVTLTSVGIANAEPPADSGSGSSTTIEGLKNGGYSCDHVSTDFTDCTKGTTEYYCQESTDTCEQVPMIVRTPPRRIGLVPTAGISLR